MTAETVNIHMSRSEPYLPWGFRLQGGKEYLAPLIIGKISKDSPAERYGLREGDFLLQISGQSADQLTHKEAQQAIINCGNILNLFVERPSSAIWAPQIKPVSRAPGHVTSSPVKYSLAHDHGAKINANVDTKDNSTEEPSYLKSETLKLIQASEQQKDVRKVQDYTIKPTAAEKSDESGGRPTCHNCGRYIHGILCKVGERLLHPECFICSTCGSNLKNKGYYNIGSKLYCEIHAKSITQNHFKATPPVDPIAFAPPAPPMSLSPLRTEPVKAFYQPEILKKGGILNAPRATSLSPASRGVPTFSPKTGLYFKPSDQGEPQPQLIGYPTHREASPTHLLAPMQNLSLSKRSESPRKSPAAQFEQKESRNDQVSSTPALFNGVRRGRGVLKHSNDTSRIPSCKLCRREIRGPFVLALDSCWCPEHFLCSVDKCQRKLLDVGFVELDENGRACCEFCFENLFAPKCAECNRPVLSECLKAKNRCYHPNCFKCAKCSAPIGNGPFYVEDGKVFCEPDWLTCFSVKCGNCQFPIETGDKFVEALGASFHADCFVCSVCHKLLEGLTFYGKAGRPYCQNHV